MLTKLDIRETGDSLIIRAAWRLPLLWRILWVAVELAVLGWMIRSGWHSLNLVFLGVSIIAVIVMVRGFPKLWRGSDVTLTVTQEHIVSDGYGDHLYSPSFFRRLRCDLTYGAENRHEDDPHPQGLYAGRTCLLPELDEEQTLQVIAVIYARFPDTGTESPIADGDSSELTTLGLH